MTLSERCEVWRVQAGLMSLQGLEAWFKQRDDPWYDMHLTFVCSLYVEGMYIGFWFLGKEKKEQMERLAAYVPAGWKFVGPGTQNCYSISRRSRKDRRHRDLVDMYVIWNCLNQAKPEDL